MVRGSIERGKVIETVFEFRAIGDSEAKLAEYRGTFGDYTRKRMLDAKIKPTPGKRQIGIDARLGGRSAFCRERSLRFGLP